MKLAILGTRGVPPRYGGFETFAAELGKRLVARGHEVTVYCRMASGERGAASGEEETRPPFALRPSPFQWKGIECVSLPSIGHKYLETVSHTALSALDALRRRFDAVLVCNAANAFVLPLLRAARIPVAINVDGIERRRRKWNPLGKAVYAAGESLSVIFAGRVIADAEVIAAYYRETYGAQPVVIPYGSELTSPDSGVLTRLGLTSRGYILYVSRFEPENNPLEVVEAYLRVPGAGDRVTGTGSQVTGTGSQVPGSRSQVSGIGDRGSEASRASVPGTRHPATGTRYPSPGTRHPIPPLVLLGEARYDRALGEKLRAHASANVVFPGALYGADYETLQRHALIYIQATEVGGTHPALIEAMAAGGCVLANDTPENREVGGDSVGYFTLRPAETLSSMLRRCLDDPAGCEAMRERARRRAAGRYGWESVTDAYEQLFLELA